MWAGVGIDWLISTLRKLNLIHLIVVKIDRNFLDKRSSFRMLPLYFCTKLYWGPYIVSVTKTASQEIGALILSMKFLLLRSLFISVNLPYGLAWNTVVMSGKVPKIATWICWISYRNGYTEMFAYTSCFP